MQLISRLEQDSRLDKVVTAGQRVARLIRPGRLRDGLHGVWLGHPLHPVLVQAPVGAWLSASILDWTGGDPKAARRLAAFGLTAAVPAAVAGLADWSEQHEQQMRVGVVHAAGNLAAMSLYGASLLTRGPRLGRALRLAGLAVVGGERAGRRPHLVPPGRRREPRRGGAAPHRARLALSHAVGRTVRGQAGAATARRGPRGGHPGRRLRCMCWPTGAATCPGRCPLVSCPTAA